METCKICGRKIKGTELQCRLIGEKGVVFCDECASNIYVINKTKDKNAYDKRIVWLNQIIKSDGIDEETKEIIRNLVVKREFKIEKEAVKTISKTKWTSLIKVISIIPIILLAIIGAGIAGALASYGDDETLFTIVGAVIGGVLGCIMMAFDLFIIEVAENIASGVDLLNIINSKIKK